MLKDPEYIGDGVYVGHDGFAIWLYANDHQNPTDRVALEPDVYEALVAYVERLKSRRQGNG